MATGRRFIDGVLGGRSQIRPINVDDIRNHLWWTFFRPEEIARLTAGVPPEILSRLGLDDFLSLQFARPNTEAVAEFIRNYSKDTHQSTVRGQQINLSLEAIRDAFHLPAGTTMCPKMKKGLHIEDWFDYYDEKKKAFWSNLCLKPGWAPILELLNALLLCRRYPKEVTGLLIWYIKTKVDPDGNPEGLDLDWASIVRKNWEVELHWIQKHLRGNKKDGKLTTGLGQDVTHLLIWAGIIQDVAQVDLGPENQVPQEGDSSEDESIPSGDHQEEDDEHLVPMGGGVEPPANDQPAAQDTTMEEVLLDDPSRERSAEAGQPLPSHAHAKAGPSSSYREESGANLGSTQANRLEHSKDLEPTNSGSERVRGPYIVHPIPRTIPSLLALRSAVQNCQPDEASRHSSMEVDITQNPYTSGSEYLIVPRRADASKHLPWAQPMEEDVRPEITALSVPLCTDRAQDRHCTPGVSSKHIPEQYYQEDGWDIISSAPDSRITPLGTDTAQDRNCTPGKMVERLLFSASAKVKTVAQYKYRFGVREEEVAMTLQQIALEPLHHDKRKRLLVVDLALDTDIDTAKRPKPMQLPVSSSTILINEPETDTIGHVQGLDIATNITYEQTLALTEARTKVRNQPDKGKKPAEECGKPFRPEQLQQLQQLELKMMAELYSKQLDAQKLNEAFNFLLRQREEEMKRLVGYLEKAPESTAEKTGQGAEHDHSSSPAHRTTEPGHSVPPSGHAETERKYRQRLSVAEKEFKDNFKNDVLPWARELLKAIHVCELDLHAAYKQTRMIHKERWIEFARVCSPAANTAQQTHLLVKQAGADQVIDPLFTGWNYGFHKIEELPDPMSLRYKPNIWYPGKEMVDLEALGRSAFVMTESTPTPVGTVGTTESTPSGETSSRGANITPSGEGSSRGANITPSGEGSSRGADVTPSRKGTSPEAVTDVPGQVVEHGREPVESPLTPSQLEIAKGLEILMRFQRFGNVPPMQVPETHYSHRINLANYDIEGKSDERIRIAVAELLTEVEREVRQASSVYFCILHKIFVGVGGDVPRYDEACEWVANKYVEMQVRCRNLTNTEYRLLNDLRELQPTAEALKHLQHRQKELRYVVEKLTSEVKILRRQKVALAVSVRSAVSYEGEGEHVLGIFAENEELKEQVAQLRSELESRGDRKHGTSIFTGPPLKVPNKVEQPGKKTVVLDLNGLLVKVANNRDSLFPCKETKYGIFKAANHIFYVVRNGTYDFIFQCLIKFNLLLWSSRKGDNLTAIIRDMETRKLIPNLMNTKCVAIWAQEECEAHHTSREDHKGGVLYAKPLDKMYELNVSTRVVLMVDDSVEKNSTNHPHQAVHPPTFDPFKGNRESDKYLLKNLSPWLERWRAWPGDTISFVHSHLGEIQAVDPWDRLVEYWGLPVAEDLAFMFSSLPRRQQSGLQSEYLRKVADARRPRLTDVEAALEAAERKHQAERDEWAKRKPPPPDEGAKRKPRPLVPQSGHAVEKDGMAEMLLQAARDPEMESMPGSNL
ncbi:hypothetical protein R1sor_008390 [Riccia sorocarpa]|uniref:FCP1 homology domain-containing protein n=1 Tax=Riccia sorocarpa TaxID=122646 RepID=A0ABD3HWP4_9MARC